LEQLRKKAKELLRNYQAGDAAARERFRATRSRLADPGRSESAVLADAQFVVAREHGFESWGKLVHYLAAVRHVDQLGLSSKPPYYRIDWKENTIEPRKPLSEEDWDMVFGVMKELGITGLNAREQMTDAALERLSKLEHVTRLQLDGSQCVTDAGLQHLRRMPQLEDLDLSGYHSAITDRGLDVLRHLKQLRRIKMCWPQGVTDTGVANLRYCDHLETVDLLGTQTGDGAINALTGKRKLRLFKSGMHVTDAGIPLFHEFPMFKTWHGGDTEMTLMAFNPDPNFLLLRGRMTDRGLASLVGLDGLFALNLDDDKLAVTAAGLTSLAELPHLGFLGLDATDEVMPFIAAMPRLRKLMCQDTNASDKGFVALSRSQSIEYIWGRRCYNLQGHGFVALATMPALRGLAVSCKNVDDAALSALPRFPALKEFMTMDVPDDGFRHVGQCAQLEALWCMYCTDTGDIATGHLAGLKSLNLYAAFSSQITDRSLQILGRLPTIECLTFEHCPQITNVGLAYLTTLPRLREIRLEGSPLITREGAVTFPANVRVIYEA
jgi:hypothetical protein